MKNLTVMMYIGTWIMYNPAIEDKVLYYRILEKYDSKGKSHTEVMLDIGFLEEPINHYQLKAISSALNSRWKKYEGYSFPSNDESTLSPIVKEYIDKFWYLMVKSGKLAEVHQKKELELKDQEDSIRLGSGDSLYLGSIGAGWFLLQILEKIEFRTFLRKKGVSEAQIFSALICIIAFTATPSGPDNDYDFEYGNILKDSPLEKLVEALALKEGYKKKLPTVKDITTISRKLLKLKKPLEDFLFSLISRFCPDFQTSSTDSGLTIVDFKTYASNNNLNQTGRHRAQNLEKVVQEHYPEFCKESSYWYQAYLFVGWISYVIINIVRYQLKKKDISWSWNKVLFALQNQKLVQVSGRNYKGEERLYYMCSQLTVEAQNIFKAFDLSNCQSF